MNPVILQRYMLFPENHFERLVPLFREPNLSTVEDGTVIPSPIVVAVYRQTGRGPYRNPETNEACFEFEYMGVRIM